LRPPADQFEIDRAIKMREERCSQQEIAAALQRSQHWVYLLFKRLKKKGHPVIDLRYHGFLKGRFRPASHLLQND